MSRNVFKAEGRMIQWALLASQVPYQAWPRTYPPLQAQSNGGLQLVEGLCLLFL